MTRNEAAALDLLCRVLDDSARGIVEGRPGARWVHARAVAAVRSLGESIDAADAYGIAEALRVELARVAVNSRGGVG